MSSGQRLVWAPLPVAVVCNVTALWDVLVPRRSAERSSLWRVAPAEVGRQLSDGDLVRQQSSRRACVDLGIRAADVPRFLCLLLAVHSLLVPVLVLVSVAVDVSVVSSGALVRVLVRVCVGRCWCGCESAQCEQHDDAHADGRSSSVGRHAAWRHDEARLRIG